MAEASAQRWQVRPPEELAWKETGEGEVVVLDLRTSKYWALNGSAAVLWLALAEGATATELVQRLSEEFEVEADTAAHDVEEFLGSCQAQHMLEAV